MFFGGEGPKPHWLWMNLGPRERIVVSVASVLTIVLPIAVCVTWEYIPGTYRRDENGLPHGTGAMRYYYPSGNLKLCELYFAGNLTESTWYHPNGSEIAITKWQDGCGVGYYVREDGTIRTKMEFVDGLAHGIGMYYNRDGTVNCEVRFKHGVPVEGEPLKWDGP